MSTCIQNRRCNQEHYRQANLQPRGIEEKIATEVCAERNVYIVEAGVIGNEMKML